MWEKYFESEMFTIFSLEYNGRSYIQVASYNDPITHKSVYVFELFVRKSR